MKISSVKDSVYLSDFEKKMYTALNKTPSLKKVKTAFDFMYMSKGSVLGEVFNRVVIASDAGSRYATDALDTKYLEQDIKIEFKEFAKTQDGYDGMSRRSQAEMFKIFRNDKVERFKETP